MNGALIGEIIIHAPSPITGGLIALTVGDIDQRDMLDGGTLQVAGYVTVAGVPARRRVRLFEQRSARFLRETWSSADGAYAFEWIADNLYFVLGFDHRGEFDPEAKADLRPEPMP